MPQLCWWMTTDGGNVSGDSKASKVYGASMWQRNKVQSGKQEACKGRLSLSCISHTIAISVSAIVSLEITLLYRSVALAVRVKNPRPPNGSMVLPFTLSACRTALWPFLRHWQWRRETHEERLGVKMGSRQDKRRQVTSSINCSRLLIRRHQCNVTIVNGH